MSASRGHGDPERNPERNPSRRESHVPEARELALIARLALPIVLTQLGTMMLGLVDTAIVGRVGATALAAVSLGNTLVFAVMVPALGIFMAVEPITSQALGDGDRARAWSCTREATRIAWLVSPLVMAASVASVEVLPLMHFDPVLVADTRSYVIARLPAVLPFYLYMSRKTYQQAAMRPRAAVEAVVLANLVHALTGFIAVHGDAGLVRLHLPAIGLPAFGGAGAGVATSASTWLLALYVASPRGRALPSSLDAPRLGDVVPTGIDRAMVRKLLHVGTPIGLQFLAEVGIFSLVTVLMARISTRAAAANQIALGLASFSFMGALGVAQATSVRVGLHIGEGSTPRARRAGLLGIGLGISIMACWAIVFLVIPHPLARLFTSDDGVIGAAVPLIGVAALFQLGDGAQVVAGGALRGAGDTRWSLAANLVAHWGIALPIGWYLAFVLNFGAIGLWYGLTAGLVVIGSALVFRFVRLTRGEVVRV